MIHGIVRRYAPFVKEGSIILHGVDPKVIEFKPYREIPGLFKEVAYDVDEAAELFFDLKEQMERRSRSMGIDIEKMEAHRGIDPTPETPWHIIVVDEL